MSQLPELDKSLRVLGDTKKQQRIHIKALRFPRYRQFRRNDVLAFDFPITALMGQNGTNKSSVLHALYGCPKGKSIAEYWFGTKIDLIPEDGSGLKQSVTHTHQGGECIKARAPRVDDPDYWEPVKPSQIYGFEPQSVRVSPVELEVTFLDFRGVLPAFDKYFYFPDPKHLASRVQYAKETGRFQRREYRKQDYLRNRSGRLKTMLDTATPLPEKQLDIISYIIEREYRSGTLVEHDLFHGHRGTTVQFKTEDLQHGYSEAFAGSGESAVALLVSQIENAPKSSLILLDEPETSLHPRAQQRLLQYLADASVKRNLQIVFTTHSRYLTEKLPQDAIRVLLREGGEIRISSDHTYDEALHVIADLRARKTVFVEDSRAQHLLESAIKKFGRGPESIEVRVSSGGTSRCYRDMASHARAKSSGVFFVLDGDHRPTFSIPKDYSFSTDEKKLDKIIGELTRGPNSKGPNDVVTHLPTVEEKVAFISFFMSNVWFLPGNCPEDLVWAEQAVLDILEIEPGVLRKLRAKCVKERISKAADLVIGMDSEALFKALLMTFFRCGESREYAELRQIVDEIRKAD